MARGRMLNKSISGSIKFHNLPDDTCRLLATWIIANLDIQGVFYGDPMMVRSIVFPRRADVTEDQIEGYLVAMEEQRLLVRYETKGDAWQYWPGFLGEQIGIRPDRETTPFPPPPAALVEDPWNYPGELGGNHPETIPQESGNHPPQSKAKQSKVNQYLGADAPTPTTLPEWQTGYLDADNKAGFVGLMCKTLYPAYYANHKPGYGWIGKLCKKHDPDYMLSLIWQHSARPPSGDPLRFVSGILSKEPSTGSANGGWKLHG